MTDMVERAARALYERRPEGKWVTQPTKLIYESGSPVTETVFVPHPWGNKGNASIQYRENCIADARTAIEAAFQVTDEDAKAFFGEPEANGDWFIYGTTANFCDGMQALSDAALKESS